MNRYILIRRLRGPALLLLIGLIALLHSLGVIHSFWHWFWPFLFILLGVLLLAERATLAGGDGYPAWPYGGGPNPDGMNPNVPAGVPTYPVQETAIVPAAPHDFGNDPNGGQS
jgi:hypothetical protein